MPDIDVQETLFAECKCDYRNTSAKHESNTLRIKFYLSNQVGCRTKENNHLYYVIVDAVFNVEKDSKW